MKVYINKQNLEYVVVEKVDSYRSKIMFLKSGYQKIVYNTAITKNTLSDDTHSIICNVATKDIKVANNDMLYSRWKNIINRCYNEKHISYKDYGAKGCYVSQSWLIYSNFLNDMKNKDNYELLIQQPKKYHIDKDLICQGNKCYCNEYTSIVTKMKNISESNTRNKSVKVYQYDLDMNFIQ